MRKISLFFLALSLSVSAFSQSSWFRVRVSVPDQPTLQRLQDSDLNLMECVPHLGTTDVALGPGEATKLLNGGFRFTYVGAMEDPRDWGARHHQDVHSLIDNYRLHYFNADQILQFFEDMRAAHPTLVLRQQIGTTINGEPLWAYRFGYQVQYSTTPVNNIVIEGLIHAREWITGSVVMHIANRCIDGLTTLQSTPFLPNQVVWIIPISNPDGYRYTWTNDRLWRKNRRHNSGGSFGVDLNRNYSKGWGQNGGSSSQQGSETYRGTAPFSEPEAVAVRDFVNNLPRVGGFIDFHSYAQLILSPWGYTPTAPPDAALFNTIGSDMQSAMNQFGSFYDQGQTANILYIASGTSNDYVYFQRAAPALGIEMRDTGEYGFELPEDQIFGTQDEAWAGFKRYIKYVSR